MTADSLVIAHRGASGAGVGAENSLPAFERAVTLGADMIEFDVRRTVDGELIAHHDADISGARVSTLTRAEIERRSGHRPPSLAEVLELAAGRIGLDVELKEPGCVGEVLAVFGERLGADGVVFTSFLDDVVAELKRARPDVRVGLLLGVPRPQPFLRTRRSELDPVARARACHADFIAPHFALARLGALHHAAEAGLPAWVWTVNEDRMLRRLFADRRVSAVITDVPERALALRSG